MNNEFSSYLRSLRENKGLSIAELARLIGTTRSFVSHCESTREGLGPIGLNVLRKFAAALDCSFIDLVIRAGHVTADEIQNWINRREGVNFERSIDK